MGRTITALLGAAAEGNETARADLWECVHADLRRLARRALNRERANHTIQPTALINELYLKLVKGAITAQDRRHFYNTAASVMRHILTDYARSYQAARRGCGVRNVTIERVDIADPMPNCNIENIDEALRELEKDFPRQAKVVEHRFFVGLTFEEVADLLGICERTAKSDWKFARAWLKSWLEGGIVE